MSFVAVDLSFLFYGLFQPRWTARSHVAPLNGEDRDRNVYGGFNAAFILHVWALLRAFEQFMSTHRPPLLFSRRPMAFLHYLSYVAAVAAFVFVTLSLASGLLYVSELIEEHSRLAKLIGQRGTYAIIVLHVLLYLTDSLPLFQTIFSITCHLVYLQNFSRHWPLISLTSTSFVASCIMAITNHFLWFIHFSHLARSARQPYNKHDPPGFTDIATFFGICVWLVPLFLFLSLSANDNALPTSSGIDSSSASSLSPSSKPPKSSLFKSLFSLMSKDRILPTDKPNSLIVPPTSASPLAYPLPPSPSTPSLHSSFLSPPPRSPKHTMHFSQSEVDPTSIHQSRVLRRSSEDFRVNVNGILSTRRVSSTGFDRSG